MKRIIKIFLLVLTILFLLFLGVFFLKRYPKNENMIWGVSFSPEYAQYLGLDVKETYRVILDDYKFKYLRLTARWDDIQTQKDKFDFSQIDYFIDEATKRNDKVILAIGQKTPRWPECNIPDWANNLSDSDYFSALNNYLQATAEHYKNNPTVEIVQVENEPFLAFGATCHVLDKEKFQAEINTVKKVDPVRPVLVTDSGELSLWNKTANVSDLFGSTVYRVVWNKFTGYIGYNWLPATYFRWRAWWHGRDLKTAFVAELQAEPWLPDRAISEGNIAEQFKSMNLDRLQRNISFAEETGFSRAYFWGAEWWYWLEKHGDPEIGNYIRNLKK